MEGKCCGGCAPKGCLLWGVVMAVLYFGLDMFFHGYCMNKLYMENAALFRPMEEMNKLMAYGWLAYLLFGFLFVCIYAKGYEADKSGAGQGLRYGFWIGLFYWGTHLLGMYPYSPLPNRIYTGWFVIGMFEFLVLGFILGMLYKPKATA